MARCILCDEERKLANEHVIPLWISRVLEEVVPGAGGYTNVQDLYFESEPTRRRWQARSIEIQAKVICGPCNNDLERDARQVLKPMVRGEHAKLNGDAQLTVAIWAYKTALVGEFAAPRTEWTREQGIAARAFHRRRRPPLQCQIWMGRHLPDDSNRGDLFRGEVDLVRGAHTYLATMTAMVLGHLVLLVARWHDEALARAGLAAGIGNETQFRRIWPSAAREIDWPPQAFDIRVLDALATSDHLSVD